MNLLVSPEAEQDLEEIEEYIGADNPQAAVDFVKRLRKCFLLISENPGIGRRRDNLLRGMRSLAEGDYIVFFAKQENVVEIVRVIHGSRDLRRVFQR